MLYKRVLLLACLFLFSACGESNTSSSASGSPQGLVQMDKEAFTISIPETWTQVPLNSINEPASGTFESAYRSNNPNGSFYNNIVILSEPVSKKISAFAFVDAMVVRDSAHYSSFRPRNKKLIDLSDGQETILHIFDARYNELTSEYVFLQSGAICGDRGYIVTIGLSPVTQDEDLERYESIIASFACKNINTK